MHPLSLREQIASLNRTVTRIGIALMALTIGIAGVYFYTQRWEYIGVNGEAELRVNRWTAEMDYLPSVGGGWMRLDKQASSPGN